MNTTWEVWRIRARTYGRLTAQLAGFLLIFWGAYDLMLASVLAENAPAINRILTPFFPQIVSTGRGLNSGFLEAVVMAVGALVVGLSTR